MRSRVAIYELMKSRVGKACLQAEAREAEYLASIPRATT